MLIGKLADGLLDIIGDVHGEISPLLSLLDRLGYDNGTGRHAKGRRLVFVGDLADRGPDSPAVIRLVKKFVEAGQAQCVLGNHELNALCGEEKDGNSWFFNKSEKHEDGTPTTEELADLRARQEFTDFFATLPLGLEREDLRVAHACWHEESVSVLRSMSRPIKAARDRITSEISARLAQEGLTARASEEEKTELKDRQLKPPMLRARAMLAIRLQNENPIKVMTSGLESVAEEPFWAGGKWRFEERDLWWENYSGPMTVVGHYWRYRSDRLKSAGPDPFEGTNPLEPLGPARNVMVVDYSIGLRAKERHLGHSHKTALAAYRWPEQELVFSD